MEFCLVYISSSANLSDQELQDLLSKSQKKNHSLGITGVLLFCNGNIIQILEGEESTVQSLYETIAEDPRHRQVIKLFGGAIEKRSFAEWLMGFKTLTSNEMSVLADKVKFIKDPNNTTEPENVFVSIARTFYKNNYRN